MQKSISFILCVAIVLFVLSSGMCASVHVSLTLDKVNYAPDETVFATVLVQDDSNKSLGNQLVTVQWIAPSGGVIREDQDITAASGTVQASLHLNATVGLGTYSVQAGSSNSTATAYFHVESYRTFPLTIIMPDPNIPIWVNGIQRSQGNTTLILSEGSYTIEVPTDYQGWTFKMWQMGTQNSTNPALTISLSQQLTISAIYQESSTTQTMDWLLPYLIVAIVVVVIVACLVWLWQEGYFDSIF